jgi:hypothetical protein
MVFSTILSAAADLLHVVVSGWRLVQRLRPYLFRLLNSHGGTGFGFDQEPHFVLPDFATPPPAFRSWRAAATKGGHELGHE